jgi:protein SCO1/2
MGPRLGRLHFVSVAMLAAAVSFALFGVSCSKSTPSAPAKHYHLKGTVVSVDQRGHMVNVDADEIPGFMDAMMMPYSVHPTSELDRLSPGDAITADVVVQGDNYWLENITITGHTTPPAPAKPTAMMHIPTAGESVPDFEFTNQSGQRISLKQYRGKTLLLTFIYTRCPFASYCPRITSEFAEINRQLQADPSLSGKTHLLSISFDTAHDTPKVLRDYGFSYGHTRQPSFFHHWEFAVPNAAQLPKIAHYFGLTYEQDGATITHSLSTTVIGPDGRIFKWYHGNDWEPAQLIKDASDALRATG